MDRWDKRAMDALLAAGAMLATLPLWALVALVIRLSSDGPVFYRSARVGKDGRCFGMYKFRTMRVGADREGPAVTASDDPRITPVGRLLRASKVDELPQLINVLRGEMSMVGPRPEVPRYVAHYDNRQRQVLSVRPGITGPTQLAYRHEERLLQHAGVEHHYLNQLLPRKLEMDLQYVREWSFAGDVRLILATLRGLMER